MENYGLHGNLGAEFSDCGLYRFLLWRIWNDTMPPLGFIGLNPSTADAFLDDPTVARCSSRARDLKLGGLIVGNLYAFRATDPKVMKAAADPVGATNDAHLSMLATLCPTILLGWGAHAQPARATLIKHMLLQHKMKPRLIHLGLTSSGQPRHPLYIGYKDPYHELTA